MVNVLWSSDRQPSCVSSQFVGSNPVGGRGGYLKETVRWYLNFVTCPVILEMECDTACFGLLCLMHLSTQYPCAFLAIICVWILMWTVLKCTGAVYINSLCKHMMSRNFFISSSIYFKFSPINSVLKTHILWQFGGIPCTFYYYSLHLKSASVLIHIF